MGGALFVCGVIVRMSPDSACTKNTMANIVASQKIDRTAALDLFILLFVLLRANVPGFSYIETEPRLTLCDSMLRGMLRGRLQKRQAEFIVNANHRFEFHSRGQLFICTHNKRFPLSRFRFLNAE